MDAGTATLDRTADARVERLNQVSVKRFDDAAELFAGRLGDGQLIPDELLSVAGLGLDLTAEQRRLLSREEIGSILNEGIAFEAVLMAGFALQIAMSLHADDPRLTYALHEIGEETRHSRLFAELYCQIKPTAVNPFLGRIPMMVARFMMKRIIAMPATMYTLVLGGEEIPDLLQKLVSEHPDSDPHLAAVNRYHRAEEARHLAFAKIELPEVHATASFIDRRSIRTLAPIIIGVMWDGLIHPGVYETVGLPGMATWKKVRNDPTRVALRHEATRPVLAKLIDAGILRAGRVPRAWRSLCGVDRHGVALAD